MTELRIGPFLPVAIHQLQEKAEAAKVQTIRHRFHSKLKWLNSSAAGCFCTRDEKCLLDQISYLDPNLLRLLNHQTR